MSTIQLEENDDREPLALLLWNPHNDTIEIEVAGDGDRANERFAMIWRYMEVKKNANLVIR